MPPNKEKLYCYVDESGQDTLGTLFIVGVVISGGDRDELRQRCEAIERESGKGWEGDLKAKELLETAVAQGSIRIAQLKNPRG